MVFSVFGFINGFVQQLWAALEAVEMCFLKTINQTKLK